MKNKILDGYWVWGKFDLKSTFILENIYTQINELLNGPNFDLHITLSGPIPNPYKNPNVIDIFKKACIKLNSIEIEVDNYLFSDKFFESIFIKIKSDNKLLSFKKNIDQIYNVKKKKFNPHISLYYGDGTSHEKEEIISRLPKLPNKFNLTKVCFVHINKKIEKWKVLHEITLK